MNMNGSVHLISNPSHVHPYRPHPKAHHSALSHSVTHDNQERRLWRSNQLWLNTECDGSHYSKSRTAKALTTIDYLNIACIRCGGFRIYLPCICLKREEVDCPPLVYWYCLSFMMTGTIFPKKCHTVLLFPNFFFLTAFLMSIFVSRYVCAMWSVSNACFSWGSMKTKTGW